MTSDYWLRQGNSINNINREKSLMTIYSQRLAGYLMLHGFVLIRLLPNEKDSHNRFLFANTPALRDCIDRWNIEKLKSVDGGSDSI